MGDSEKNRPRNKEEMTKCLEQRETISKPAATSAEVSLPSQNAALESEIKENPLRTVMKNYANITEQATAPDAAVDAPRSDNNYIPPHRRPVSPNSVSYLVNYKVNHISEKVGKLSNYQRQTIYRMIQCTQKECEEHPYTLKTLESHDIEIIDVKLFNMIYAFVQATDRKKSLERELSEKWKLASKKYGLDNYDCKEGMINIKKGNVFYGKLNVSDLVIVVFDSELNGQLPKISAPALFLYVDPFKTYFRNQKPEHQAHPLSTVSKPSANRISNSIDNASLANGEDDDFFNYYLEAVNDELEKCKKRRGEFCQIKNQLSQAKGNRKLSPKLKEDLITKLEALGIDKQNSDVSNQPHSSDMNEPAPAALQIPETISDVLEAGLDLTGKMPSVVQDIGNAEHTATQEVLLKIEEEVKTTTLTSSPVADNSANSSSRADPQAPANSDKTPEN